LWEDALKKNPEKSDGRGKSPGSRRTQFSSGRQPDRSAKRRKSKGSPDVYDILHKLLYEPVKAEKSGKGNKIPFVEALLRKMRNNAFYSDLRDQLKYLRELVQLGVFELEEYKDKLFNRLNNHFKGVVRSLDKADELLRDLGEKYKAAHLKAILMEAAYCDAASKCECGAYDGSLDAAHLIMLRAAIQADEAMEKEEA
jgi:hypothetical protein